MGRIFHPLLFLLARCSRNQLTRQIEFLKAEHEILRSRLPRIVAGTHERDRLLNSVMRSGSACAT
jgi:putative transposase